MATNYSTNLSQNESKTDDVSQPNKQISGGGATDFLEDNELAQIDNIALGKEVYLWVYYFRDK